MYMKARNFYIVLFFDALLFSAYAGNTDNGAVRTASGPKPIAGSYVVAASYPLENFTEFTVYLQLLQDSRLPERIYNRQYGDAYLLQSMYDENGVPLFKYNPPLPTVLRFVRLLPMHIEGRRDQGDTNEIERVFWTMRMHTYDRNHVAWLEKIEVGDSGKPTYLFTRDDGMGMGHSSGPVTRFYNMDGLNFIPVEFTITETGEKREMVLSRSARTAWEYVESKDGNVRNILSVSSGLHFDLAVRDDGIVITYYNRYYFNGEEWLRYTRSEEREWWMEISGFPATHKFPRVPYEKGD